jgi:hypothetical protein
LRYDPTVRSYGVILLCASGCFVSAGVSYSPSSTITVQRAVDPMPITIKDGTATINLAVGLNFDILGVGLHYAWYAARVLRSAEGMPRQPNASGGNIRLDVDVPYRFGPKHALVARGSYRYEWFDKLNNGGGAAEGNGHHGGVTIAAGTKDLALSVLVGKYDLTTLNDPVMNPMLGPRLGISTWDIDIGLTIRFVPSGVLFSRYVPDPGPIYTGAQSAKCGWRIAAEGGGYVCDVPR